MGDISVGMYGKKEGIEKNELSVAFKWRQRIGFGTCEFGRQFADYLITTYLLVFLTDTALMNPAKISLMFVILRIVDAMTDYMVGVMVDKTRTKSGRSHPWMRVGVVVLAIGLAMLFNVPFTTSKSKTAYMYIAYFVETFGMTLVAIPHGALIPSLTDAPQERTLLSTVRGLAGGLAQFVATNAVVIWLVKLGDGTGVDVNGYFHTAMVVGIVTIVMVWLGLALTKEINLPPLSKSSSKKHPAKEMLEDLKYLFTNKYYIVILIVMFGELCMLIPLYSELVFFYKDVVHDMRYIALTFSSLSITQTVITFIIPFINKKLSKKQIAMLGEIFCFTAFVGLFIAKGFPISGMLSLIFVNVWAVGNAFVGTMAWAMQPEVFDAVEYKSGRGTAAVPTAICSYACKLGNAISGALAAALLAWGGYNGAAEVQTQSAINGILAGFILVPLIASVISFVALMFYDLDKVYPAIHAELVKRRKQAN